jgi:hypothetical protein
MRHLIAKPSSPVREGLLNYIISGLFLHNLTLIEKGAGNPAPFGFSNTKLIAR